MAETISSLFQKGTVSTIRNIQTVDATNLCIINAGVKFEELRDYDIGGTFDGDTPELWFYITTSKTLGNINLLNLFVCHRSIGNFTISITDKKQLDQSDITSVSTYAYSMSNTNLKDMSFVSAMPNTNHHIQTFSIPNVRVLKDCNLFIPIKITSACKFQDEVINKTKYYHRLINPLKDVKTDFIIKSPCGKEFPTHKLVLAAHSSVFRDIIRNGEVSSTYMLAPVNVIEIIMKVLHTGNIEKVLKKDCLQLLEIADKYQLGLLCLLIQSSLREEINVSNAVHLATIANRFELVELKKDVFDFIRSNPGVTSSQGWKDLQDVELAKRIFEFTRDA